MKNGIIILLTSLLTLSASAAEYAGNCRLDVSQGEYDSVRTYDGRTQPNTRPLLNAEGDLIRHDFIQTYQVGNVREDLLRRPVELDIRGIGRMQLAQGYGALEVELSYSALYENDRYRAAVQTSTSRGDNDFRMIVVLTPKQPNRVLDHPIFYFVSCQKMI